MFLLAGTKHLGAVYCLGCLVVYRQLINNIFKTNEWVRYDSVPRPHLFCYTIQQRFSVLWNKFFTDKQSHNVQCVSQAAWFPSSSRVIT